MTIKYLAKGCSFACLQQNQSSHGHRLHRICCFVLEKYDYDKNIEDDVYVYFIYTSYTRLVWKVCDLNMKIADLLIKIEKPECNGRNFLYFLNYIYCISECVKSK